VEVNFDNKQLTMTISVGMELPETSRNRDKVCWTRDNNTSQEPTQSRRSYQQQSFNN